MKLLAFSVIAVCDARLEKNTTGEPLNLIYEERNSQ